MAALVRCCRLPLRFGHRFMSSLQHGMAPTSADHSKWYDHSLTNPEQFWGDLAAQRLLWRRPFDRVMDCNVEEGRFRWFDGGQLNVCENVVDRHVTTEPDKVALIWEKDEPGQEEKVTYKELKSMVCRLSNVLKSQGVKRGDRVALYMPVSPLAVCSMLACARIGAVHNVVFAGFSAEALRSRINDAQASIVITADEAVRGGKKIPLKATVDKAVEGSETVKQVLVMTRTGGGVPWSAGRDIRLEDAMASVSDSCEAETMDSEDNLFILYTSGSTGRPKGIVHTQSGYLLYAGLTHELVFDYKPGDVFACVADIGWITGHSYAVYGPLLNGATSVLFESIPTYPDPGRYWEMISRLKITHFYTSPTAVRLLIKAGDDYVHKHDRSSLRILGCVGEPLNVEAWLWYNLVVGGGRCPLVDTWWQTETGGIMISPRPAPEGVKPKPGYPMIPFFGIDPVLVNEKGEEIIGNDVSGMLCIRKPWPGMARTIHGDHSRFLDTYFSQFPGLYFTGDGAHRDAEGHYQITGRVDDVINVKGHRLGTAEIESAIDEHPDVAESAVVGFPHEVYGEGIYAYVTLKDSGQLHSQTEIIESIKNIVKHDIGSFAVPEVILLTPALPKTRSGKIMRRILRKVAANETDDLGDVSTLADPSVVDIIKKRHAEEMEDY